MPGIEDRPSAIKLLHFNKQKLTRKRRMRMIPIMLICFSARVTVLRSLAPLPGSGPGAPADVSLIVIDHTGCIMPGLLLCYHSFIHS